ncbi:hypothetical protein N2152v2_006531 [Parachlorella kessleri]|uniref:Actin related protein3 n=1 Tax=Parachlorella kessleri TaxID=3074 RepID=A0A140JWN9_PARKE|nr:actin related protein3 [Parachlorella kessleri]
MGLAGNVDPALVEPTVVGYPQGAAGGRAPPSPLADLDYVIGSAALSPAYAVSYPMKQGLITDWDSMEKLWASCFYKCLKVFPEDQYVILTEPPLNPPEARELTAEIFFETFDAPGLHIGVQAVLALYASFAAAERKQKEPGRTLTGLVVDSGDGCTHAIPVAEGYVIGSHIKSIPLAGRDVTSFTQQLLRERGEPIPPEQSLEVARQIKERHAYVCADMVKEFAKYDESPAKYLRQYEGAHCRTGQPFVVDVGYERFLGPEIFFNPEIYSPDYSTPLPRVLDSVIQNCPIDTRRALYGNIVLSGGTTMFKDFGRRIQRDLKRAVEARTQGAASEVEVNVMSHPMQRYAVWFGGSVLGMSPGFKDVVRTREEYFEYGPGIVRNNPVFRIATRQRKLVGSEDSAPAEPEKRQQGEAHREKRLSGPLASFGSMGAPAEQCENDVGSPDSLLASPVGISAASLEPVLSKDQLHAAKGNPGIQEQPAQLLVTPDTPAQQHSSGFSEWLRTERAKGDTFGYCLALAFHVVTLSKYKTLPASHIVYYSLYTAAVACLLAVQRSGHPAYAAWRDWVQAAIRLDVFLSPARISIWEQSVSLPPPSLPGPAILSYLATLPVACSNTFAVHLLMLPFAHPLGLWPHLLVQTICVARVAVGVFTRQLCQKRMFMHPTTEAVLCDAYQWLESFMLPSFRPLTPYQAGVLQPERRCLAVVLWLVVVLGFVASITVQVILDARLYRRFLQEQHYQRQQHDPQPAIARAKGRLGVAYDRLYDGLTGRYLLGLASACSNPYLWALLSIVLWDALVVVIS